MDEERRDTPEDEAADDTSAEARASAKNASDTPEDEAADDTSAEPRASAVDASGTTAPSIGPNTIIDRSDEKSPEEVREDSPENPETGLKEIDVDAMGNDKRRQVVGKSYGASAAKQVVVYGVVVALIVALAFGAKLLVDHFDKPPAHAQAQAPWAQPGAPQNAPQPLE